MTSCHAICTEFATSLYATTHAYTQEESEAVNLQDVDAQLCAGTIIHDR